MMSQSQGCSQEKSPWGCLVSPGCSSKGGTGPPRKLHSAPSAAGIWGKRLGAKWELSKAASPAQLLGWEPWHLMAGAATTGQAAGNRRV